MYLTAVKHNTSLYGFADSVISDAYESFFFQTNRMQEKKIFGFSPLRKIYSNDFFSLAVFLYKIKPWRLMEQNWLFSCTLCVFYVFLVTSRKQEEDVVFSVLQICFLQSLMAA